MSVLAALVLVVLPFQASAPTPKQDEEPDGNKLVQCTLRADREAIQPGSTFTLGVHFKIEPKWHIYWENPGDSGMATKAEIKAPEGYVIGAPRYPWPTRDEEVGDIIQFVHASEMMMLFDVKVPTTAKPGSEVKLDVVGDWLVCKEVCVKGAGTSSLTLKVAEKEKLADEKLFDRWRARLPRPWSELARSLPTWTGEETAPTLKIVVPGATGLEFFPRRSRTTQLKARKIDIGKQGGTITLDFEFERENPDDKPGAHGVLWVKTEKGETSYVLESPFSKK